MPPPVNDPPDPQRTLDSEAVVMGFFNLEGAGLALRESNFTQHELVTRIVAQARDSSDPKVSQKAIAQLLSYLKEIASVNGRIGNARREITSTSDSAKVREVVSTSVLTSRLASRPAPSSLTNREFIPPSVHLGGGPPVERGLPGAPEVAP